jgi:hypothetical protein
VTAGEYLVPVPAALRPVHELLAGGLSQRAVADRLGCHVGYVWSAVRRLLATYPRPA